MTDDTPLPFDLPAVCRKKLTVDFNGGTQSSDGGLSFSYQAGSWTHPRRVVARLEWRAWTSGALMASNRMASRLWLTVRDTPLMVDRVGL